MFNRWSAIEEVLERILILWHPLSSAFAKHGVVFPLESHHRIVQEFYSVLVPCRKVQKLSQRVHSFVSIEVYLDLVHLYGSVLLPTDPLEILNPLPPSAFNGDRPAVFSPASELDRRTTKVCSLLRKGMNVRFFNRYHPILSLENWRRFYGAKAGSGRISEATVTLCLL